MHKDLLRLARAERSVRIHLACSLAAAVVAGLLVLVQAELLAGVLSGRFAIAALLPLALVVACRGLLGWAQGVLAGRAATALKSALRRLLLGRVEGLGPAYRSGELVTLAGRGLDALDPYLTGYLPSVAVAGIVPVAVVVRLFVADLATAVIVVLTLPLIPIFGALVGWTTKTVTERQWRALARLGGHFLDVVRGLPTLRAFGRARYQASVIREVAEAHRAATMRTLRVAFLSSLVLELVASLSLALVAVPVGLRLLSGSLDLRTALLVLLLAPEAYLPLRAMGTRFHAAMEGVAAADEAFAVINPPQEAGQATAPAGAATGTGKAAGAGRPAPAGGPPEIRLEDVTVRYPGREETALDRVSLVIEPGERLAIVGPSGAGKSTLLHLLLGFVTRRRGGCWWTGPIWPASTSTSGGGGSPSCHNARTCSRRRWPTTSRSVRRPVLRRSGPPRRRRRWRSSPPPCRRGTTPRSASAARTCRRASVSGSPWPGPSAAPPPGCCCWTSPRRGSTAGARRRSWRPRAGWRRAVRRSSSRTARR